MDLHERLLPAVATIGEKHGEEIEKIKITLSL